MNVSRQITDADYQRLLELRTGHPPLPPLERGAGARRPASRPCSTSSCWPSGATGTAGDRRSARSPTRCSCATTARSGWPTGPRPPGLVRRRVDADDHRVVRLTLTAQGRRRLDRLSALHLEELDRLRPQLRGALGRAPRGGVIGSRPVS